LLEDHIAQEYNVCFPDASVLAQVLAWMCLHEQTALSKAKQGRRRRENCLLCWQEYTCWCELCLY